MDTELLSLLHFIKNAKTPYHTVEIVRDALKLYGYTELSERDIWQIADGGKHFVIRGGASLIAFNYKSECDGFNIIASHSDQPALRVKESTEGEPYVRLTTERYGGMLNYTWLDRPLNISGRAVVRQDGGLVTKTVTLAELAVVPSVAIHLNRGVNDSLKLDPKKDMLALFGLKGSLCASLADALRVSEDDIVSHELYLVSADDPKTVGSSEELILSPRLDDLECVFASLTAFIESESAGKTNILAIFNNEEVGSETKQGAASTFLYDTLCRISGSREEYLRKVASSFMLSADNAHAKHPNSPELSDAKDAPLLSSGVVIKHNSNQRYATDAESCAVFTELLRKNDIKYTHYYNRADLAGGSTLGSISNTRVSLPTVDIGAPQLAMHSIMETASCEDYISLLRAMCAFYESSVRFLDGKTVIE